VSGFDWLLVGAAATLFVYLAFIAALFFAGRRSEARAGTR
jgi:hypothetical protein